MDNHATLFKRIREKIVQSPLISCRMAFAVRSSVICRTVVRQLPYGRPPIAVRSSANCRTVTWTGFRDGFSAACIETIRLVGIKKRLSNFGLVHLVFFGVQAFRLWLTIKMIAGRASSAEPLSFCSHTAKVGEGVGQSVKGESGNAEILNIENACARERMRQKSSAVNEALAYSFINA